MEKKEYSLLIIDDDPIDRATITRLLSQSSYSQFQIKEANNAIDGAKMYLAQPSDCILLDYRLPDITGLDFIKYLNNKLGENLPAIVVLTAHGNEELAVLFLKAGAADYLSKEHLKYAMRLEITITNSIKQFELKKQIKQKEQELRYLASHDELTGLPNRRIFERAFKRYIAATKRYKRLSALLFIDLNKFKAVNDTFGHVIGDAVLKEVALRLNKRVRQNDMVARLSGDEFTVLLSEINSVQEAAVIAERVCQGLAEPYMIKDHSINITASIGIVCIPTTTDDPHELIQLADHAMYKAKTSKVNIQMSDAVYLSTDSKE